MVNTMNKSTEIETTSEHTVAQLISAYTKRLELAKVYAPYEDAQALLAHAIGIEFEYGIPLSGNAPVNGQIAKKADSLVKRRENREPLARIIGSSKFWGLQFTMADKVFRPDPHAETLVDNALIALEDKKEEPLHILDLGTGSGCLLLALLHNLPNATGVGVDVDERSIIA
ncbi:MAG TPA: hypothetical protein DD400_00625, partial [Rhodospirillaceae bacterium]|nr:hypothetical protein [Rhodospirillaceae bacterium]